MVIDTLHSQTDEVAISNTNDRSYPWIGGGQSTSVQGLMTAKEAIVAGGLDWETDKVNIQTVPQVDPNDPVLVTEPVAIPDKRAIVRRDTGRVLGVVGKTYQSVQNGEAFDFADGIVASSGNHYDVIGSTDYGRQVFLVIDLAGVEPITIAGDPGYKTFLVIRTSHDGSSALSGMVTPIRIRCRNALPLALRSAISRFSIRHSGDVTSKMGAARNALGISVDYMRRFEQVAERLIDTRVSDDHALKVFRDAFAMKDTVEEKGLDSERFVNHAATQVMDTYTDAVDLANFRGTAWGVVNAVAEFVDHDKQYGKGSARSAADVRTSSVLWGQGANVVNRTVALVGRDTAELMDARTSRAASRYANRVLDSVA